MPRIEFSPTDKLSFDRNVLSVEAGAGQIGSHRGSHRVVSETQWRVSYAFVFKDSFFAAMSVCGSVPSFQ